MKKPASQKKTLGKFAGSLVLAGAGKMGSAMLNGWLARGLSPKKIVAIDPKPSKSVKVLTRRGLKLNPKTPLSEAAVLVIAVKPQTSLEALAPLAAYVGKKTLVLSIMAGRTLAFLQHNLPPNTAIVRAMPNTPAAVGRSITVAVPNGKTSRPQRKKATDLLAAIGKVEWVDDENLMDAVTAVSGSGPAYVFLLTEAMTEAGIAMGLSPRLAARLARETVAGSGELLNHSQLDASTLRQNVTSPGGTTAAALDVLMKPDGFETLLKKAIAAATKRSRELAG